VTRRLTQFAVIGLVVAYAFPGAAAAIRSAGMTVAAVALLVLALGLVFRPLIYGLRPRRREERERRDWPFG
jgi:cytochrome bd-type quinol oxidase subunit 2